MIKDDADKIKSEFFFEDIYCYPQIEEKLDTLFTKSKNKIPKKSNGEFKFIKIMECLTLKKKLTCEMMAKYELGDNSKDTKSIADGTRRFLIKHLLPMLIVKEDGFEKQRNKKIKCYSLTPFGILYSIHLFSHGKNFEYDLKSIKNISKTYCNYLPKIFKRFDEFEKIIGSDFYYILTLRNISDYIDELTIFNYSEHLLNSYSTKLGTLSLNFNNKHIVEEQISFILYNNMLIQLELLERRSYSVDDVKSRLIRSEKVALKQWQKIIRSDHSIHKWYCDLIKDAMKDSKEQTKILKNQLNIIK
jgi:hypothetical protein